MGISKVDWVAEGEKRFGKDAKGWKFKCPMCGRVQSYNIIRDEIVSGTFKPKRVFKMNEAGMPEATIYAECTGAGCNYVSYGFFSGPVTVIHDPEFPHDENVKKNCSLVFEFADA